MSVEAISWALSLKVERSSAKFVLVAMANCANADMECWPSIQYLCEATCQDRKTVLENIKRLKVDGFISDLECRKGRTCQVIVYRLNSTENGTVKESQKRNSTENGTVPKTDANSPVFPIKQSRFSVETVPKTGHGTVRNRQGTVKEEKTVLLAQLPPDLVSDFLQIRKAKKLPLTKTAVDGIEREAGKAGVSLESAIRFCCEYGWGSFNAGWYADRNGKQKKQSYSERMASVADELTGRNRIDLGDTNVFAIAGN